jgi:hypothetical protein
MWHWLWGLKTYALMDIWTLDHLIVGISIGHLVKKRNQKVFKNKFGIDRHFDITKYFDIIAVLFLAFLWETIEHYLETGLLGDRVTYWFQGVEFWGNRMLIDPLMLVLGYLIAKNNPKLVIPARIVSVAWLAVNVFIFPHSMYVQQFLLLPS